MKGASNDLDVVTFPSDIVPENEDAREVWMHQWADAIVNFGQQGFTNRMWANYNCADGIVNVSDFSHITDLVAIKTEAKTNGLNGGYKRTLPAKLRPVNIVDSALRNVIGRVEGEGLEFSAHVVNEDAVSSKLEELVAEEAKQLTRFVRQQSGIDKILGGPLHDGDDVEQVVPKEVEEMSLSTFQQENEVMITRGLRHLMAKPNLFIPYKLAEQGLRDYLISGVMVFDTFIENDPTLNRIHPVNAIWELDSNSPFIHHGRYAGYNFQATPQELIDRCPELTDEQVEQVENLFKTMQANGSISAPSPFWNYDQKMKTFTFTPFKLYWKGLKKERVKVSPNRFDEENPHISFIGDECDVCKGTGEWKSPSGKEKKCSVCKGTGKVTEDLKEGQKIETRYFNTIFECTKIIDGLYYQCREIPGQHQSQDEPAIRELPLIGIVSPNPSMLDLIRPLQELRIEAFFTIERLMGQAKGNLLLVDEAGGQDVFGQIYNALAYGIYAWDSSLERPDGKPINPPMIKDMGMSQAVTDMMKLVAFIDQNINEVTGRNEAARGIVKSDQTSGVTQNAVQQMQLTLQPYYSVYYTVVEMALQALCNLMRPAWAGKKKTAYFMGDEGMEFLDLDPGSKWDLADYGVFLVNSVTANQAKKLMLDMAMQLASTNNDQNLALASLRMFRAKSDAECERIFTAGVNAMNKMKEKLQQQEQENKQEQNKIMQQKLEGENKVEMTKAEAPIKVKELDVASKAALQKEKLTHAEDTQSVQFKNDILLKAAEILQEKEKGKIEQEQEKKGPKILHTKVGPDGKKMHLIED